MGVKGIEGVQGWPVVAVVYRINGLGWVEKNRGMTLRGRHGFRYLFQYRLESVAKRRWKSMTIVSRGFDRYHLGLARLMTDGLIGAIRVSAT